MSELSESSKDIENLANESTPDDEKTNLQLEYKLQKDQKDNKKMPEASKQQDNKKAETKPLNKLDDAKTLIKKKKTSSKEVQGLISDLKSTINLEVENSDGPSIYAKILNSLEK